MQALNTRYAAFYFSEKKIVLDIVPHGIKEVFRYESKRSTGNNPAADFSIMANALGDAWWKESKRTNKNYLASQHVLKLATRHRISDGLQRPRLTRTPSVKTGILESLEIKKTDLYSHELKKIIKSAYRHQAKMHHPDAGGQAAIFRKIHNAYKELLRWADNPVYIRRRGFPDKWYYDGESKKWVQPAPGRK